MVRMLSHHLRPSLLYWIPCLSAYAKMFPHLLINRAKIAFLPQLIYRSDIICQHINSALRELPCPVTIPCTYFYRLGMHMFSNKSNRGRIGNGKGILCTKPFIAFRLKKAYPFFRMNERPNSIPKW